jgi:hypothetical protein
MRMTATGRISSATDDQRQTKTTAELAPDLAALYQVRIDDHDPARPRYIATARTLGTHPHTVVTADPAELRSALAHIASPRPAASPERTT